MLNIILVGLVLMHALLGAEKWPDSFVVDARGVSWAGADGSANFHENSRALVVEGAAPFGGKVVCSKQEDPACAKKLYESCVGVSCRIQEEFAKQTVCFRVECTAVPANSNLSISHEEFGGPAHTRLACWNSLFDANEITVKIGPTKQQSA